MTLQVKILWGVWICCAAFLVWHTQFAVPFPNVNIDEHAHYSYTLELMRAHRWWPDFYAFPLSNAATGHAIADPNYLNHPPTFYWLMERVQRTFPQADPIRYRIPSLLFCLAALAVHARVGMLQSWGAQATLAYALLPLLLYVPLAVGYYSNDSLALLGGAIACLGSVHWLRGNTRRGFYYLCAGVLLASVKLTGLLLVGLYALLFLLQQKARKKLLLLTLVSIVAAIPYAILWLRYGSPAPETPGQVDWLTFYSTQRGWLHAPRMDALHWTTTALASFTHQFKGPEITAAPLLWLLAAFLCPRTHSGQRSIIRAAGIATLLTLIAHLAFSYPRYQHYGWLYDMFTRYYFPLLPAYGIAIADLYLWLSRKAQPV